MNFSCEFVFIRLFILLAQSTGISRQVFAHKYFCYLLANIFVTQYFKSHWTAWNGKFFASSFRWGVLPVRGDFTDFISNRAKLLRNLTMVWMKNIEGVEILGWITAKDFLVNLLIFYRFTKACERVIINDHCRADSESKLRCSFSNICFNLSTFIRNISAIQILIEIQSHQ